LVPVQAGYRFLPAQASAIFAPRDRFRRALRFHVDPIRRNVHRAREILFHCIRAALREFLVVVGLPDAIGMTGNEDGVDPDVTELAREIIEGRLAVGLELRLVEGEQRVRRQLDALNHDLRRRWWRGGLDLWRRWGRLRLGRYDHFPRDRIAGLDGKRRRPLTGLPALACPTRHRYVPAVNHITFALRVIRHSR
jgi:hypothetical protein